MNKTIFVTAMLFGLSFVSCTTEADKVRPLPAKSMAKKKSLERPINCPTAQEDIATLEKERSNIQKQMSDGSRTVIPSAAAAALMTTDYSDRIEVTTYQFNAEIETKIAQIKTTCSL